MITAIPAASPIILSFKTTASAEKLVEELKGNDYMMQTEIMERFEFQFTTLKSLFKLGEGNLNAEIITVVMATGANDYDLLYLTSYPKLDIYSETALKYFREEGFKISKSEFRNEQILELENKDFKIQIFQEKEIMSISFSSVPVEASVIALKERVYSFESNQFSSELEVSADEEVTVLILHEHLSTFFPILIEDEFDFLKKSISSFADISILNIYTNNNAISLFGKTLSRNKRADSLKAESRISDLNKLIPSSSCFVQIGQVDDIRMKVEEFGYFKNWMDGLYAHVALETFSAAIEKSAFLMVAIDDKNMAEEDLMELNSINNDDTPRQYKQYTIYSANYAHFINRIFPNEFINIDPKEFILIDDILVIANNSAGMNKLIDLYESNQVLKYNPKYEAFSSYLGDFASSYFYFNPERALKYSDRFWRSIPPAKIGIQYSRSGKEVYSNIVIQKSGESIFSVDELLWKAKMKNSVLNSVHLVTNHNSKEQEAFVQDGADNIYLIGQDGDILWDKKIDGKIIGDVHQLDFLNNGKLQMLFTTDSLMYLLDRSGDNVAPYPIQLSSKPIGGATLVEYDLRSAYRIFIAGENGNIYGYYKDGRPLPGWNPKKGCGELAFPLQHIVVGQKDWLIAANKEGTIMMFNRKGESRLAPINSRCKFHQPFHYTIKDGKFTGVTTSDKGLFFFTSEAKITIDSSVAYSDSLPVAFSMRNEKEYLINMSAGELAINEILTEGQRNYTTPFPTFEAIQTFDLGGVPYIGIYSKERGEILLMDFEGNFVEDFPMKANPPFTVSNIASTKESVLLATDKDGLFAYRLRL
ncbi:MAG: hypothetical protein HKN92_10585 [Chitinophagales bacterium]|nr:hypothetical protein [Chitinophagales bacterium]